jgi:hypothetical protein
MKKTLPIITKVLMILFFIGGSVGVKECRRVGV